MTIILLPESAVDAEGSSLGMEHVECVSCDAKAIAMRRVATARSRKNENSMSGAKLPSVATKPLQTKYRVDVRIKRGEDEFIENLQQPSHRR